MCILRRRSGFAARKDSFAKALHAVRRSGRWRATGAQEQTVFRYLRSVDPRWNSITELYISARTDHTGHSRYESVAAANWQGHSWTKTGPVLKHTVKAW